LLNTTATAEGAASIELCGGAKPPRAPAAALSLHRRRRHNALGEQVWELSGSAKELPPRAPGTVLSLHGLGEPLPQSGAQTPNVTEAQTRWTASTSMQKAAHLRYDGEGWWRGATKRR